jgi:hypothetical protein
MDLTRTELVYLYIFFAESMLQVLSVSSELKTILKRVVEEDFKSKEADIDERLRHYKSLILKIEKAKKFDVAVWIEGSELKDLKTYERDLNLLERSNLVKGQMKYTERTAYREYMLTRKGTELAQKLSQERP